MTWKEARLTTMITDAKGSKDFVCITETMRTWEHCMPCPENWPISKREEVYIKEYESGDPRTLCQ